MKENKQLKEKVENNDNTMIIKGKFESLEEFNLIIENQNLLNQIEALKADKFKVEVDIKEIQGKQEDYEKEKAKLEKDKEVLAKERKAFEEEMRKQKEILSQREKKCIKQIQEERNIRENGEKKFKKEIAELKLAQEAMQVDIPTLDSFTTNNKGKTLPYILTCVGDYQLRLLLLQEKENTEKAATLSNCLKEELEHSLFENKRLKDSLQKEREKRYDQNKKDSSQKSSLITPAQKVSFASSASNNPDTSADNFNKSLRNELEINYTKRSPYEKLKEALKELDEDLDPKELPIEEYAESICSNKKLSRDIKETLQILLKRENKEIEKIKEKVETESRMNDNYKSEDDNDETMEDDKSEIKFLEQRVESLSQLKDLLQTQLDEEYSTNRDLRRQNKDLSDSLLEHKEKLISKIENESKAALLTSLNDHLSEALQNLLSSCTSHLRSRSDLTTTILSTSEGKLIP